MAEEKNDQQEKSEQVISDQSDLQEAGGADGVTVGQEDQAGSNPQEQIPDLPDFSGMVAEALESSIELIRDVDLNVKIELGRTEMTVNEILKLNEGSVVELDKLAGDPVDVLVNEQLVARGEVLVLNENFCVRINEIIPGLAERIAQN